MTRSIKDLLCKHEFEPQYPQKIAWCGRYSPVITKLEADGLWDSLGQFVTSMPKETHGIPEDHTQSCPLISAYLA